MSDHSDLLDTRLDMPRPGEQTTAKPPSSEIKALDELRELGEEAVFGIKIDKLLQLARQRWKALGQLQEAERVFSQAVPSKDYWIVKEKAFLELCNALKALQEVKYPEGEEFALRRQALEADIARARALQEAIEIWWWRLFSEHVADFYRGIALPEGTAQPPPESALIEAVALWENWPQRDGQSLWRPQVEEQAEKTLQDMREALANRREELKKEKFTTRLAEAEGWLNRASEYLGPQEIHMKFEPLAALSCLARAKVILDDLTPLDTGHSEGVEKAEAFFKSLQEHAYRMLPRRLSEQRQEVIKRFKEECKQKLREWSSTNSQKDPNAFLAEKKDHRDLVDEIRFHFYLAPELNPEEWLQELILARQDNLLKAPQLLREVQARWQSLDRQSYTCWALEQLKEAHRCDPDSNEIKDLKEEVAREWSVVEKGFNFCIAEASKYLNASAQPTALPQNIGSNLVQAHVNLQKAEDTWKRQKGKRPPGWEQTIRDADSERIRLKELYRQVQKIGERWDDFNTSLQKLIEETEDFVEKNKPLPVSMKYYLQERIQEREDTLPDKQILSREGFELGELIEKLSQ